jgi:sec-independent protein translocase protein TatA
MTTAIILGVVGPWQIILIIIVVLLLFGGKKIPELMHGIGKGIKSFKEGMSGEEDKNKKDKEEPKKE